MIRLRTLALIAGLVGAGLALLVLAWAVHLDYWRGTLGDGALFVLTVFGVAFLTPLFVAFVKGMAVWQAELDARFWTFAADTAEAIARQVLADRSWQGERAESVVYDPALEAARTAACELLRACPPMGDKVLGHRELGWDSKRWQAAADALRPFTYVKQGGPPQAQGTYVTAGTVGDLLARLEKGEVDPAPAPAGDAAA